MDKLVIAGPKGSLEMAAMSPAAPVLLFDADGKLLSQHIFECPSPFYSSEWATAEEPKDKEEPKKEGDGAVAATAKKDAPPASGKKGGGKSKKR